MLTEINEIDREAIHIIEKLQKSGFIAYLVGGAVRDSLLGITPKDFDIVTSATPIEIKKRFSRALIIGRRFKIVHVYLKNKIFEVSTFRKLTTNESIIRNDNIWGSPEEDTQRRDFTINSLMYNPINREILDFNNGITDIDNKKLKTIIDPNISFKQDPVRMIRLLKFKSKLNDFKIDKKTEEALINNAEEISKSSPSRVLDEIQKMLEQGFAKAFFLNSFKYGLLKHIFYKLHEYIESDKETFSKLMAFLDSKKANRDLSIAILLLPFTDIEYRKFYDKFGSIPSSIECSNLIGETFRNILLSHKGRVARADRIGAQEALKLHYKILSNKITKKIISTTLKNKHFSNALKIIEAKSILNDNLLDIYEHWKKLYENKNIRRHKH